MSHKLFEIKFAENDVKKKQELLRVGDYIYRGKILKITKDHLLSMKENFDSGVLQIELAVDYSHESGKKAAGWIGEVSLSDDGEGLFISVNWTKNGGEVILGEEFKYLSADFSMNYMDNATGKKHGVTLKGAALTNRPVIKGMDTVLSEITQAIDKSPEKLEHIQRILSDNPKEETKIMPTTFAELKAALVEVTLSETEKNEVARLIGLEIKDVQLSEQIVTLQDSVKDKDATITKLSDSIKTFEKEKAFDKLLSDGNACPAQKDAFMSDDIAKFSELNVKLNMKPKGSGSSSEGDDIKTLSDANDKLEELTDKLMKEDESLTFSEAQRKTLSDNPEIEKILEAG